MKKYIFYFLMILLVISCLELASYYIYHNYVWNVYLAYIDRLINEDLPFAKQVGYYPHHNYHFESTPNYVDVNGILQTNSASFRGKEVKPEKTKGVTRIICFGASTTYGSEVRYPQDAYPQKLESELQSRGIKAEVINAGIGGGTIIDSLLRYTLKFMEYSPDIAIIYQAHNDILALTSDKLDSSYAGFRKTWIIEEPGPFVKLLIKYSFTVRLVGVKMRWIPGTKSLHLEIDHKSAPTARFKSN